MYLSVSNQQDEQFSFIDLFIDLFESALHVSHDKLAHLQEYFLTVHTALVVQCTDIAADRWHRRAAISAHCTTAVCTVKKCSWSWASLSPEICRADSNRSIKRSINEDCCILLVAFIVVQLTYGLTNVNVPLRNRSLFNDPSVSRAVKILKLQWWRIMNRRELKAAVGTPVPWWSELNH